MSGGKDELNRALQQLLNNENYIILSCTKLISLSTISSKIAFDEIVRKKGDLLTVSNNGIKIGDGVTRVKINATVSLSPTTTASSTERIAINKNGNDISQMYQPNISGATATLTYSDYEIDVKKGDVIYLHGSTSTAGVGRIHPNTQFKVSVVR